VKNQLRSTVGQDTLCDLSLLTIEADLTNNINFESIVAEFAKLKCRKKTL
jgi:SAM-dependent MidA family methyltransferase